MAVLGVDGCKEGWVGIVLDDGGPPRAVCAASIAEVVALAGAVAVVAVDMPIGLPVAAARSCDLLAKQALGRRSSSIFLTPVRAALEAPDHEAGTARSRAVTGMGISRQAFGLGSKILEVDAWCRTTSLVVVEAHPELSFAALAGGPPVPDPKTTWAGMARRRRLLADAGIELADDLGLGGRKVAVDDVLDAAAVAWTARRVLAGTAVSRPDPPEVVSPLELPAAIWT